MSDISQFNNKFYRVHAIGTDKYGIDPLKDSIVPRILAIEDYSVHLVTQDEKGAPDLISKKIFDTEDYWWHIMVYNGLCLYQDIVEGMSLRIPDIASIIQITTTTVNTNTSSSKNITVI